MKSRIGFRTLGALVLAALYFGPEVTVAKNKDEEKPAAKEEKERAIEKMWKDFQDIVSGRKAAEKETAELAKEEAIILRQLELEMARENFRWDNQRHHKKGGPLLFLDAPDTRFPAGDYFDKWPPKGQGPMPRLNRPTDR